jgi:hypothetical protein
MYLFVLALFCHSVGEAQEPPSFICVSTEGQISANNNGLLIPSVGTIRAIWIVCKFSSDAFDFSPFTDRWPSAMNTPESFPSWTSTLLSPSATPPSPLESITRWYREMSRGDLQIIGDVFEYVPAQPESYYFRNAGQSGDNRRGMGFLHKEILTYLDQVMGVDFSRYDRWTKQPNGTWLEQPDGTVDLIIITHRFFNAKRLQQYPHGFETDNNTEFSGIATLDYWQEHFFLSARRKAHLIKPQSNLLQLP